ncbi:hypothetical protein C5Y44_09440 [Corynebacterium sp. J010B-136]|nr:hypothetical protein C5Y44_09440 [Corynebacterium sp. J010B-136]
MTAAELNGVNQLWEVLEDDVNNADPTTSKIDVGLLELININLGQISLPLLGDGGLLQFVMNDAQVGALNEFAHAQSPTQAIGAVGVVSDSGGLELTQPGEGANATINILSLLDLQNTVIAESIIDEARLSLGAVSAGAIKPSQNLDDSEALNCAENYTEFDYSKLDPDEDLFGDEEILEQEDGRICSSYQIADAELVISSPLVGGLVSDLGATLKVLLGGVENTLNGLLGSEGVLGAVGLILGPVLSATVEANIDEDTIIDSLLIEPLTSSDGLVTIDLTSEEAGTGLIKIDLEKLHTDGLNQLDPNTSLLTGEQLSKITDSITNLLTASAVEEPNGLNAKLDHIIRGQEQDRKGGLYATEIEIAVCGVLCLLRLDFTATLGGLLTGAQGTSDRAEYEANPYDFYHRAGLLSLAVELIAPLLGTVGEIVEGILFGNDEDPGGLLSGLITNLQTGVVSPLLNSLNPALTQVLDPIANIIVNRQTLTEVEHGTVFTVSALELNVLDLGAPASDVIHLPLATAAVMAQNWKPREMQINIAKQGDGRNLHNGGYTYDLRCFNGETPIFESELIDYPSDNVGEGFEYSDNSGELRLVGASGFTTDVQLPEGATCQLSSNPSLSDEKFAALRPTGTTPSRTPYTYFLNTDEQGLHVSTSESSWESIDGLESINTDVVEDGWKQHAINITVPAQSDEIQFNIVHSYDIDTRAIEVIAVTDGEEPAAPYVFEYSIDEGATWQLVEDNLTTDVLLIDGTSLEPIQVLVREQLPDPAPDVRWVLREPETPLKSDSENGYSTTEFFNANHGIDEDSPTTPNLQLIATNGVPISFDFSAMLPDTGRKTLVWILGLGLLSALGALIMHLRGRND